MRHPQLLYPDAASRSLQHLFCWSWHQLPPPSPYSTTEHCLPHLGDTYLRNGATYYKRLKVGGNIYIPYQREIGEVEQWRFGLVQYKPQWYFSNCTNSATSTDNWLLYHQDRDSAFVAFGRFVIALPILHQPTRCLFAQVSPYTASDSCFVTSNN